MELMKPTIVDHGICADHNMPCAVMGDSPAVLDGSTGIFKPSWKAQEQGWMLVRVPKWLRWFMKQYENPRLTRKERFDKADKMAARGDYLGATEYLSETSPLDIG